MDNLDGLGQAALMRMMALGRQGKQGGKLIVPQQPVIRRKIGRNDKCHCGSGKKYKKCCLQSDQGRPRHRPASKLPREKPVIDGATVQATAEEVTAPAPKQVTAKAMLNANVDQRIVWAYLETGLYITEVNRGAHPEANIEKWEAALAQFDDATEDEQRIMLTLPGD